MSRYQLESHWHLDAPIEAVWDALFAVEDWSKMNVMAAGATGLNAWLRARGAAQPR